MKFPVLEIQFMWLYKHTSGSCEAKVLSLCWACASRLWDLRATTFPVIGNASRSCSHPQFVSPSLTPTPRLFHPLWNCVWLKEQAGLKPAVPRRKNVQTTQRMRPRLSKGSPEQRRTVIPIPSPFPSDRGCQVKARKIELLFKTSCLPSSQLQLFKISSLEDDNASKGCPRIFSLALKVPHVPHGRKGWQAGDTGRTLRGTVNWELKL